MPERTGLSALAAGLIPVAAGAALHHAGAVGVGGLAGGGLRQHAGRRPGQPGAHRRRLRGLDSAVSLRRRAARHLHRGAVEHRRRRADHPGRHLHDLGGAHGGPARAAAHPSAPGCRGGRRGALGPPGWRAQGLRRRSRDLCRAGAELRGPLAHQLPDPRSLEAAGDRQHQRHRALSPSRRGCRPSASLSVGPVELVRCQRWPWRASTWRCAAPAGGWS